MPEAKPLLALLLVAYAAIAPTGATFLSGLQVRTRCAHQAFAPLSAGKVGIAAVYYRAIGSASERTTTAFAFSV